jgi:Protein of unknown function (DUF2971)
MTVTPPPTVTRFYGNVDFALDVIRNTQITFVHVTLLNDPFDPYCFFETDFEAKYPNLLKHVRQHHPKDMPWFRAQVTPIIWGTTVHDIRAYLDKMRATTFMLSTSALSPDGLHPKDNLYMWGHYGNGHRGVAIEFDTEKLAAAVLKHHEIENAAPLNETSVWSKVEYAKTFAPIAAEDVFVFLQQEKLLELGKIAARRETPLDQYYRRMSIIKSDVWQSENEWRLMWRSLTTAPPIYKCPITQECISNIYIGQSFAGDASAFARGAPWCEPAPTLRPKQSSCLIAGSSAIRRICRGISPFFVCSIQSCEQGYRNDQDSDLTQAAGATYRSFIKRTMRHRPCSSNIEMTPLCKVDVTLPRVLGSRGWRRGGVVR